MMLSLKQQEYHVSKFGFNIPRRQGDLAVASYETDDPEQSFKVLTTSNEPWTVKFREHLKKAHGIDIAQSSTMQLNEIITNWKR